MSHSHASTHQQDRDAAAQSGGSARAGQTRRKRAALMSTEECERLLDNELDDTFPASDPPSWTMGGSLVGKARH